MANLNIKNAEELIFYNKILRSKLPDFENLFSTWDRSIVNKDRAIQKRAIIDFLSSITQKHIQVLKGYFNEEVKVDSIDCHMVKSFKFPISGAECGLCGMAGYANFAITRDADQLYISYWR